MGVGWARKLRLVVPIPLRGYKEKTLCVQLTCWVKFVTWLKYSKCSDCFMRIIIAITWLAMLCRVVGFGRR